VHQQNAPAADYEKALKLRQNSHARTHAHKNARLRAPRFRSCERFPD
jgi:hypothetical protein